eukprot:3740728-Rhodomonas_salina.3
MARVTVSLDERSTAMYGLMPPADCHTQWHMTDWRGTPFQKAQEAPHTTQGVPREARDQVTVGATVSKEELQGHHQGARVG